MFLKHFQSRFFSTFQKRRLPAIISDIDGVLLRGGHGIGGSDRVVKSVLSPIGQSNQNIPFTLLTNGGGIPESERATNIIRNLYPGEASAPEIPLDKIIVCHTPFSQPSMLEKYGDSFVLVSGLGKMIEIADDLYGYSKAIEVEELFSLYPESCPSVMHNFGPEYIEKVRDNLMARMAKKGYNSVDELKQDLKFDAIFLLSDAVNLEMNLQIMCDLLASNDGRMDGGILSPEQFQRKSAKDPQHVKLYISNPDLEYADTFELNRHGQGIIIHTMNTVFRKCYPNLGDPEIIRFGKPEKKTFDFAKDRLEAQASKQNVEISNYYMIGDNPYADIKGGNDNDCVSILVRTGVWQSQEANDEENPAKFVVDDVQAAYQLILEKEGLAEEIKF